MENNTEKEKDEIEIVKCPCCGASMKKHWHRLSAGLANTLIKFREECIRRGTYKLRPSSEVAFSKTEYNNFQKLRYHALVAKAKDENKKHIDGLWILTKRGNQFCKNQIKLPVNVQTFRNKITDKSKELVSIYDVLKMKGEDSPYWDTKYDFPYELQDVEDIGYAEGYKADKDGNGLLF